MNAIRLLIVNLSAWREQPAILGLLCFGFALLGFVLMGVAALLSGIYTAGHIGMPPDTIVITSSTAASISGSQVPENMIPAILNLDDIAVKERQPELSAEVYATFNPVLPGTATPIFLGIRGVSAAAFRLRPDFRLLKGRMFNSGPNEILVGQKAARQYSELRTGRHVFWRGHDWTVVGTFADGSGQAESEIWTSVGQLQSVLHADNYVTAVYVRLKHKGLFHSFESALTRITHGKLAADKWSVWQRIEQGHTVTEVSDMMWTVVVLLALGSMFASVNLFRAAMRERDYRMAIVHVLGFNLHEIIAAHVFEAGILGLFSTAIATLVAGLVLQHAQASFFAQGSNVAIMFDLNVSAITMLIALGCTLLVAECSICIPMIRLRRRLMSALRSA